MRYDNEEAWFRACLTAAGTAPIDIGHHIEERDRLRWQGQDVYTTQERERMKREAVSVGIQLLRGALTIHRRATEEGTTTPFDSLLAYRLEQATKILPEGWKIVVTASSQGVSVDLYNALDERQPTLWAKDSSEAVFMAVKFIEESQRYGIQESGDKQLSLDL